MSQSNENYPSFNFNVQGPAEQLNLHPRVPYLSSNGSQQCMPRAPQSVQYNMPRCPSTSVRSPVTASTQRFRDRLTCQQPRRGIINDKIDPSLPGVGMHLAPPGHVAQTNFNIERSMHDEAWNPLHLTSAGSSDGRTPPPYQSNASYQHCPPGPGSVASITNVSDSGFCSQSAVSNDANRLHQTRMFQDGTQQIHSMKPRSARYDATIMSRVPSDQRSRVSRLSSRAGKQANGLECPQCQDMMKCKSDYKKHILKHEKRFMCDVLGCKRLGQGFSTVNDLDRHKKSVHRIGLTNKSYQCASKTCRNKEKIWPRLDNFKQHIERMHKGEDHLDLIKRSSLLPKEHDAMPESLSMAPIDTMLVGMDKLCSIQSNYGPIVDPDLRVEHDINRWPAALNPTSDLLNFYQTSDPITASHQQDFPIERDKSSNILKVQGQSRLDLQRKWYNGSLPSKHHNPPQGIAKDARSVQCLQIEQQKEQHHKLSDAPQTKAQQQRQALKKLSKAVSNEMEDSSVDLERLLLNILAKSAETGEGEDGYSNNEQNSSSSCAQNDRSNQVFLTKSEAIKATQMISNLIKQSPGSAYSQPRKSSQGFTANNKVCDICGYAVARDCDLKKHLKRHAKPYGCTYPKCHKRFGAKSDWKRHENSQHFQLEAFRCSQTLHTGTLCGEHFFRLEPFKRHLETQHKMSQLEDREAEAKARRIGKNCQQQFWCGFHNEIIVLKERRNAAWDERFDHIAHHFEKDKKSIEEWVCAEENKTKKELLKGMDRYVFDEDDERVGEEQGEHPPPPSSPPTDINVSSGPSSDRAHPSSLLIDQIRTRITSYPLKRPGPKDLQTRQVQKKLKARAVISNTYCCQCTNPYGPFQKCCISCEHQQCGNCQTENTEVFA